MLRKGLRVAVAGCGLIGGSIALKARSLGAIASGWDASPVALSGALDTGVIDRAATSFEALASACDVLVLAAPLDATLEHLAVLTRRPSVADVVVDVASVKTPVAIAGASVPHFVATHPLAGSERSGFSAARADLFEGRVWAYLPGASASDAASALAFIAAMGARPLPIAAEKHDRVVALTSHLPQLLSVLLGAQLARGSEDRDVLALCGTGMASMLRLAGSSWPVWQPVLAANALPIAQEVRELSAILLDAADALEMGSAQTLAGAFASAKRVAERLEANGSPLSRVDGLQSHKAK